MAAVDVRFDEPEIRVAPPGPLARAVIAKDAAVMSPSCHREFPLVMERGEGVWVWDVDGNRFLDVFAGIAVSAAGHNHPAVVAAVQAQVEKFLHAGGADVYYPVLADLAEALARLGPGKGPNRVLFTNSGTESIEAAVKLARYHTTRPAVIAFYGAFHGRTMGSLSLTASRSRYRRHMGRSWRKSTTRPSAIWTECSNCSTTWSIRTMSQRSSWSRSRGRADTGSRPMDSCQACGASPITTGSC